VTGPVLETERLILRVPIADDFDAFAAFAAEEETNRHLGGVKTRSEAWRFFTSLVGAWVVDGFAMFSVIERDTGRWVGRLGPWSPPDWPGTEVGWGVRAEFAGRGFAFEGSSAAMDFAVDRLGWTHIIHTIAADNVRSIALAKRLGSVNEGPTRLPAPYDDVRVDAWGQTADEWRRARASG